ncbi:hypothetical protein [Undibacterium fentianense]|uniref:Response regulatory domain-containing protein n=1 Tax=Undibacterium fentianense TaxID=2828728 RepID=A0A941IGE8_9BURK|nr:hypothetical protein [Undibacterium fentianense]MBR7801751.1 hypothetical protein [Undibacterium fentianense]
MPSRKKWRSILCINEDQQQLNMQGLVLGSMANLSVYYCNSLHKAVDLMKAVQPDVVLFDSQDNDDIQSILKGLFSEEEMTIPFICLVNTDQYLDLAQVEQQNMLGVIVKPIELLQLPERVLDILEFDLIDLCV